MKRKSVKYLALFLAFSMAVSPLSYTRTYAMDSEVAAQEEVAEEGQNTLTESENTGNAEENGTAGSTENGTSAGEQENAGANTVTGNENAGNTENTGAKANAGSTVTASQENTVSEIKEQSAEEIDVQDAGAATATGGVTAIYASDNEKKPGDPYSMFSIAKSQGVIDGDKLKVTIWINPAANGNFTYDAIYIGSKDDETKTPLILGNLDNGKQKYEFSISKESAGKEVHFVPRNGRTQKFSTTSSLALKIPELSWFQQIVELQITEQPKPVNVKSGETAKLSVGAEGTGLSYQWQYSADGKTWTDCTEDSAKTAEYSFTMEEKLAGQYRCVVKDSLGKEMISNEVKIDIKTEKEDYTSSGEITAIYASDDAKKPGQAYTMLKIGKSQATIKGSQIEVSVWVQPASSGKFSYDAIYIGNRDDETKEPLVMGVVDTELNLEKFSFEVPLSKAGGEVHFVPRSASKGTFSTSSSLAFKLPALDEFKKPTSITITKQPEATIITGKGTEVSLEVAATGDEGMTLNYQWQYSTDGTNWAECTGDSAKTAAYSFTMEEGMSGQQYRCVIKDETGTTVTSNTATVKLPTAPTVTGYKVKVVKSDGVEFPMFKVSESEVELSDNELNITISTKNTSFDKISLGSKDDVLTSTIVNGEADPAGGWKFNFTLPVDKKGQVIPVALHNEKKNIWYTSQYLWMFIPDNVTEYPTDTDSIKTIAGGTGDKYSAFNIKSSKTILKNNKVIVTLNVEENKWTKLYQGAQADKDKSSFVTGTYDLGKNVTTFTFSLDADKQGMNIPVTPGSDSGWFSYARDLFINIPNLENKPNTTENGVYDLYGSAYPTNNYASLSFERESKVTINGDTATVTLVTQAANYDKIYIGDVADDDAVKDKNAVTAEDRSDIYNSYRSFTFKIPTADLGKEIKYVVHNKKSNTWSDKQSAFFINGILPKIGEIKDPDPTPGEDTKAPADGIYSTTVETGAAMFKVVDAVLTSKNGKLTALITLSGVGYDYLYMGSAEAAGKADESSWIKYQGTKEYTDASGTTKNGRQYEIPVEALDKKIAVASRSDSKKTWYDRTLTFSSKDLKKTGDIPSADTGIPADGVYTIEASTNAAMFKVVKTILTVKNGKVSAAISLSGTGYDYLYAGTAEAALKAGKATWAGYTVNSDGKYTYTIPVTSLTEVLKVASHSERQNKWYDREITFDLSTLKKISNISDDGKDDPTKPSTPSKPGNQGTKVPSNNGKADKESKYESDTSGSTGHVNNATSLKDGVYTPDRFTWSGGSGRVKIYCNKVTVTNGQAYATLIFSSDHYQYVKANGNIYYTTKGGGQATVVIPIELNKNNKILGMTDKMSAAHEIAYNIFVYLAAAANGSAAAANANTNKTLDEKAPEIMGLTYQSETKLEYAQYFKIYHYDQGITLLEVDMTKDTARDPEKLAKQAKKDSKKTEKASKKSKKSKKNKKSDSKNSKSKLTAVEEEAGTSSDDGNGVSESELATKLYKGNIVKYLLVPENVEVPVGLDQEMIIVKMPNNKAYAGTNDILKMMDKLGLTDKVSAVGMKKKDCKLSSVADKIKTGKDAEVMYAGKTTNLKMKMLVKQDTNLVILPENILPRENQKLSVSKQTKRYEKLTEKLALLGITAVVDRSADEKEELAKAEWIKVYGVLFGCEDQANKMFVQTVKQKESQEKK